MTEPKTKPINEANTGDYGDSHQPPHQIQHHYHPPRKLYRSTSDKWIAGVCGGLAGHFNMDPTLVRLLWIVVTILSVGIGVIVYLVLWIFVDKYPSYYYPQQQVSTTYSPGAIHYHHHFKPPR
ncbi:MAG: PspC domain-containing protein [Thermoplasmata archaeon]|nr:MAG: PspC domain-containing protein [Thermoplasmata archaeon]